MGHDIGGMVAYAYARMFPDSLRGVMILDAPVAWASALQDETLVMSPMWHVQFHLVPGLAETLVAGREAEYFRYFLQDGFSDDDLAHYVRSYADPSQLHAIFEMYRAFPQDATWNARQTNQIDVPLVVAAGSRSPFLKFLPRIADDLRAHGIQTVSTKAIKDSSHYVAEEAPEQVIALIERYGAL